MLFFFLKSTPKGLALVMGSHQRKKARCLKYIY